MRKKAFEPAVKTKFDKSWDSDEGRKEARDTGICDWSALDHEGRTFYGSTQAEAEKLRATYHK